MQGKLEKATDNDFSILGLRQGSSPAEVKKAYRDLVKLWHPDRYQQHSLSERRNAEEKLKEIAGAYRRISQASKYQERRPEPRNEQDQEPAQKQSPPETHHSHEQGGSAERRPRWWTAIRRFVPRRVAATRHNYGKDGSLAVLLLLLFCAVLAMYNPLPDWLTLQDSSSSTSIESAPPPKPPSAATRNWTPRGTSTEQKEGNPPAYTDRPEERLDPPPLFLKRPSPFHFTLGSTEAEVIAIQGYPTRIHGQTWVYRLSEIQFKNGKVCRYNNFDGSLRVRLDPPTLPHGDMPLYFTLGSTPNEVLLVQGTPTRIDNSSWFYGFSEIRFKNGRVANYDNYFGNLKVKIFPSDSFKWTTPSPRSYFTVGSSRDEVLAVQGTPTSIQGNLWFYQLSNILFRDGRVQYVVNTGGNLRFAPPEDPERRKPEPG